ncbi:LacI family DNA-binding transcriptional regulator [Arthrobacter sp. HY1533]|uniref:LacI family DNA-binding transcriptional regulator n=1 Tax=Arthrobacter sp. HY1533 TaxID=2970919 RepID=UPI0022B9E7BC|nr:LacI family DNA-binding transcriptional regulator [Arthrobacter sp. HY1533]
MATLEDVAKLAGVSKSTASRALGKPELVARSTADRVRSAAETLAFFPNRAATALASGRSGLVAMVVPTLENSFFTPIVRGAQIRANESELHLTIVVNGVATEADAEALRLLSRQVDGFLIAAPKGNDATILDICSLKPSVLIDREIDTVPSVVADTEGAFRALAESFAAQGHRNIAFIGGPDNSWQNEQRTRAVRGALADRAELSEFGTFDPTFAAGFGVVDAVVRSGATAVISYSSAISLGLMHGLQARGVRVPEDIVVSADEVLIASLGMSRAPSINVDGELLGSMAMDRLVAQIGAAQAAAHEQGRQGILGVSSEKRERLPVPVLWT